MLVAARRSTRYLALVLAALIVGGGSTASAGGPDSRLLVKFRRGISGVSARAEIAALGARDARTIHGLNVHVIAIPWDNATEALQRLKGNPRVEYAEPDALLTPQELLPSDPSFPQQFAIAGGAWGWYRTHTTQAWDVTKGDPSVVVAILDTGLKTRGLADYDGQIATGWNVLKSSTDTSSYAGTHGTYVAESSGSP